MNEEKINGDMLGFFIAVVGMVACVDTLGFVIMYWAAGWHL